MVAFLDIAVVVCSLTIEHSFEGMTFSLLFINFKLGLHAINICDLNK